MTPDERALKLLPHGSCSQPGEAYAVEAQRKAIAEAIREAVAAEREACARVAEMVWGDATAPAIRARTTPVAKK